MPNNIQESLLKLIFINVNALNPPKYNNILKLTKKTNILCIVETWNQNESNLMDYIHTNTNKKYTCIKTSINNKNHRKGHSGGIMIIIENDTIKLNNQEIKENIIKININNNLSIATIYTPPSMTLDQYKTIINQTINSDIIVGDFNFVLPRTISNNINPRLQCIYQLLTLNHQLDIHNPNNYNGNDHIIYNKNIVKNTYIQDMLPYLSDHKHFLSLEFNTLVNLTRLNEHIFTKYIRKPNKNDDIYKIKYNILQYIDKPIRKLNIQLLKKLLDIKMYENTNHNHITNQTFINNIIDKFHKLIYIAAKKNLGTVTKKTNTSINTRNIHYNNETPTINHIAIKHLKQKQRPIQDHTQQQPPNIEEFHHHFNKLYNTTQQNNNIQNNLDINTLKYDFEHANKLTNHIHPSFVYKNIQKYNNTKTPGPDNISPWLLKLFLKPKIYNDNNNNNTYENNTNNATLNISNNNNNNNNIDINNHNNNNNNNTNNNHKYDFKKFKIDISTILSNIYKIIILTNVYPEVWKKTHTTLIPKNGISSSPNDYRGITLSPLFDRFYTIQLKKAINKLHPTYLKTSIYQAANKKGYSAQTQTITLQSHINNITSKDECILISIDFAKAFDNVNRNILYKILQNNGWNDTTILTLVALFEKRTTQIKYNNNISKPIQKPKSIEQGNGLSGIMFDIYIDKLIYNQIKVLNTPIQDLRSCTYIPNLNKHNTSRKIINDKSLILGFADDNNSVVPITYAKYYTKVIYDTASLLQININYIKSTILRIKPEKDPPYIIQSSNLTNQKIPIKTQTKVLGFYFNSNGLATKDMSNKIKEIVSKAHNLSITLNITNHIDDSPHPKAKLNLFKSHIQSLYEYFLVPTIISTYLNDDNIKDMLEHIYKITNNITSKIICSNPNNPPLVYSILGLSNIYQRIFELQLRVVHQILTSDIENPITKYIRKINHTFNSNQQSIIYNKNQILLRLFKNTLPHILHIQPKLIYFWFPDYKPHQNHKYPIKLTSNTNQQDKPVIIIFKHKQIIANRSIKPTCCQPVQDDDPCPINATKIPSYNTYTKQNVQKQHNHNGLDYFTIETCPKPTIAYYNTIKNSKQLLLQYLISMRQGYFDPNTYHLYTDNNPHVKPTSSKLYTTIPLIIRNKNTLVHSILQKHNKKLIYDLIKVITKSLTKANQSKHCFCSSLDTPNVFKIEQNDPDLHIQHINKMINLNLPHNRNIPIYKWRQHPTTQTHPNLTHSPNTLLSLINHKDYEVAYLYILMYKNSLPKYTEYTTKTIQQLQQIDEFNSWNQRPTNEQTILLLIHKYNSYLSSKKKQQHHNINELYKYIRKAFSNATHNILYQSNIQRNRAINQSWATPKTLIYPLITILNIKYELCSHAINSLLNVTSFTEFKDDRIFNLKHDLFSFHELQTQGQTAYINPPFHTSFMKKAMNYIYKELLQTNKLKFVLVIAPECNVLNIPNNLYKHNLVKYQPHNFAFIPPQYPFDGNTIRNGGVPFTITVAIITNQDNLLHKIKHKLTSIFYILKLHDKKYNKYNYNKQLITEANNNEQIFKYQYQTLRNDTFFTSQQFSPD